MFPWSYYELTFCTDVPQYTEGSGPRTIPQVLSAQMLP